MSPIVHFVRQRLSLAPAVLAIALLVALVPTASAQRAVLQTMVRDTVLANGLHVIAVRSPSAPYATIKVVVRTGAFTQLTDGDEGVPHLLEHMLFKAAESWGKPFKQSTGELDASSNGTTGDEAVAYYVTLPSKNLEKGVKLMWDLMKEPE